MEIPISDSGHSILSAGSGDVSGTPYPGQIVAKVEDGKLSLDGGGNHYWVPTISGRGSGLGFVPGMSGPRFHGNKGWEERTS